MFQHLDAVPFLRSLNESSVLDAMKIRSYNTFADERGAVSTHAI